MSHSRRLSSRRRPQVMMVNHGNARPNRRFWIGSCVLFVFWYLFLYGFDSSFLSSLSSVSHNQKNSLQSSNSDNSIPESDGVSYFKNESSKSDNSILESVDVSDNSNQSSNLDNSTSESDGVSYDKNQSSNSDNSIPESDDVPQDKNVGPLRDVSNSLTVDQRENEQKTANDSYTENDTIEDIAGLEEELGLSFPEDEEREQEQENRINSITKKRTSRKSCTGRYIYIHDIPARFNVDYVRQCKLLNKWHDMCQYFVNDGLGESLGNPQRLFLRSGWYVTHQFSLEVIFHNRMKQYECLTNDSSKASAIYIPYYPGLDVSRYLWDDETSWRKDKDLLDLFQLLRTKPEWNVMGGKDHFLVSGRITWDFRRTVEKDSEWGNKLMVLPESQNMTMLTIESSPWDKNDFAIPYPTYFHPSSDNQVYEWQNKMRRQKRRSLFCFAGAPRPNMEESIRDEIMAQCTGSRRKCRMIECKDDKHNCLKPANVMKMFQNSVFCLQPPGDSFTRRSAFDSILAGCIPVFFTPGSAYVQYLWHLPKDYRSYSVLIPEGDVKQKRVSIDGVLSQIPKSRVSAMRENVIKLIPNVVYADPRSRLGKIEDAFDLTIKGVVQRVEMLKKEIREGRNYSDEFDSESSWKYYTFGTTKPHEWDHYFRRH